MTWLDAVDQSILLRMICALLFGGLIGLERSYHGRPAGFRTHALVSMSTCLLMLITSFEEEWLTIGADVRVTIDPTRMAQGIMTGIGFLGAGAIIKDGVTVRGLTTAASIWTTAAIGILIGIGFYTPALIALVLTLGTLSVFRWIESRLPMQFYAHFTVRFQRDAAMPEPELRALIAGYGFTIANLHYRLDAKDDFFEYRMVVRAERSENARLLLDGLHALPSVVEFRLAPTGD